MMRADFDPNGNRNPQNRGSKNFVRITWQQALDTVASEISRVVTAYGVSAIYGFGGSHQWNTNLHTGSTSGAWGSKFFALLGEYTTNDGEGSIPHWSWGGYLSLGGLPLYYTGYSTFAFGSWFDNNNLSDLLANCKLVINWSTDPAVKSYTDNVTPSSFEKLKAAGVKIMSIDHWQNDTATVYADKFFSIVPGTDEAMMAAIAYVWITQNLYNKTFVSTHTTGFTPFSNYVLGISDGTPKTPAWAETICGVEAGIITALALEWASKPTYVLCENAGANRRPNGVNWVRMIITLQAMLGYLGAPGCGIGGALLLHPHLQI